MKFQKALRLFYDFRAFISTLRVYSSWLSCSSNRIRKFVHAVPLHWPHAGEHSRPCLRQVHLALALSDEQLNRIICRNDSGAAGRSVIRGSTWPSVTFHPQSSNDMPSFSPFHCFTCRYTLRLWCRAAADIGGRFWGCIWFWGCVGSACRLVSPQVFLHRGIPAHFLLLSQYHGLWKGSWRPLLALWSVTSWHISLRLPPCLCHRHGRWYRIPKWRNNWSWQTSSPNSSFTFFMF